MAGELGVDFSTRLGLSGALAFDRALLVESLARRLRTRKGALFYDPDYGSYLPEYLGESFQDGGAEVAVVCALDIEEDPRVAFAVVSVAGVTLRGVSLQADVTTKSGVVIPLIIDAVNASALYPPEIEVVPYGVG